jgi:amidase
MQKKNPGARPARWSSTGPDAVTRRHFLRLAGLGAIGSTLPACSREDRPSGAPPSATAPADTTPDELHYASLTNVARLIESGQLSPVELTRAMLDRIEAVDGRLKSYATVTAERALAAAETAEQEIMNGRYRGPLHGVPIAVKDLCYTKGIRTMGGLAVYRDFVPDHDGTAVARLEAAGAVLLGKLNLTEGAMAGYHPDFDIPVNPWNADYWSGASSSGSGVAVAAGLCFAALGSDTGGSIRFPSMANGTVGLKPTYGRVSRYGVIPLGETLDHVGPMTRSVADSAVVLEAIAGQDPNDPTSLDDAVPDMLAALGGGIEGIRIGVDWAFVTAGTDPGLVTAIRQAADTLAGLGAEIVEIRMPAESAALGDAWFPICSREAYLAHADTFPSRADEYGPYFREFLAVGQTVTEEQYAAASQARAAYVRALDAATAAVDAVVLPAGGFTFPMERRDALYGDMTALQPFFESVQMQFTIPADFAGTPALTLPCGFSADGIPYALQFMGPRLSEPLLCRIGHAYEAATDWHERHPSV